MKIIYFGLSLLFSLNLMAQEASWPKEINAESGELIVLYQPQLDSINSDRIKGRMAISIKTVQDSLIFGAVFFKAKLATDFEKNLVSLESFDVLNSKFPEKVSAQNLIDLSALVENEMMSSEITSTIDELKASISEIGVVVNGDEGLKNDPPQIFYRDKSTVLVSIDGEPKFKATEDKSIEFVANTPFLLAREKGKSTYYLKGGDFWYQSTTIEGDWTNVDKAPKSIESFAEQNKSESAETPDSLGDIIPAIIVVTKPSELLVVDGDPEYSPIDSTQLLFIKNTESDIIVDINTQKHFVLIAGRFYSSTSLKDGEWTFVEPKDLPSDFAKIPESSDMASVKNNVPGTSESQDALLEQSIPQTAAVDRTKTIEVTYDGDPQFQQISGTAVEYALNSPKTVLRINGDYYAVDEGIWFESSSASGSFTVALERPSEIDDIPASSPVYNVKYVYVYDVQPEVVYVGYTPGYYHSYVYNGVVVYGTGYHYQPWYGTYYYPRPMTYGYGVHYSPYSGWGFSVSIGYGWVGWGCHPYYRPYWGPRGYYPGYRHGYNHGYHHGYHNGYRAGYRAGSNHGRGNVYGNSRGVRQVGSPNYSSRNPSRNVGNSRPSNARPNNNGRPSTRPAASTRPKTSSRPNNVYSDKKGNVYQRGSNGSWNNAGSSSNRTPSRTPSRTQTQQLNRSHQSRQQYSPSRSSSRSGSGRTAPRSGGGRRGR